VITSNYKAEYDQISSAAVTAETKSGTNRFEGQVFGTYTGENFRAETAAELASNPNIKTSSKDKEFGFAAGGPIIRDVMHFFVTYEARPLQLLREAQRQRTLLPHCRRTSPPSSDRRTRRSTRTSTSASWTGSPPPMIASC
jgi:hypothetical protein